METIIALGALLWMVHRDICSAKVKAAREQGRLEGRLALLDEKLG